MKKLLLILAISVLLLGMFGMVSATRTITGVTVNGGSSTTVAPGATVTVVASVTVSGGTPWGSTRTQIDSLGWNCQNTPDHTANGAYTETFSVTAPTSAGVYPLSVTAHGGPGDINNCDTSYSSNTFTLSNAITVAQTCTLTVNNPLTGNYYKDSVPLAWAKGSGCIGSYYDLYYQQGSCSLSGTWTKIYNDLSGTSYPWQTGFSEGQYCFRVEEENNQASAATSGLFYIDNIAPTAEADGPYSCDEGSSVVLNAAGSHDNGVYQSGIASYEWRIDGEVVGTGSTYTYTCLDGTATHPVTLTVTDVAGNSGTDSSTLTVNNLPPVCESMSTARGYWDSAVGYDVGLVSSAHDPAGSYDPLTYTWNFGDSSGLVNGASATHKYTHAGEFSVVVSVSDGDGGTCTMSHVIEVENPTHLTDQEVAAYYNLGYSFDSGLTGLTDCEDFAGLLQPGMSLGESGNNCAFAWTQPTNNQQGVHPMLVRATNGEDHYYYDFDTTVYSWIIPLEHGWNLISIPLVSKPDASLNTVLGGIKNLMSSESNSVYQYDSTTGSWKYAKPTESGWTGTLTEIVPGQGYWIYVNEDTKLKGFGTQTGYMGLPPETTVATNHWSLVGKYGILGDGVDENGWYHNVEDAMNTLKIHSSQLNVYKIFDSGNGLMQLASVDNLYNNHGYWLFLEDNSGFGSQSATYAPAGDDHYTSN